MFIARVWNIILLFGVLMLDWSSPNTHSRLYALDGSPLVNNTQHDLMANKAIEQMIMSADLLVVVTPQNITHGKYSLKVDAVYKGDINIGSMIFLDTSRNGVTLNAKDCGLMDALLNHKPILCFLTHTENETYTLSFAETLNSRNPTGGLLNPKAPSEIYRGFAWLRVSGQRTGEARRGLDAIVEELLAGMLSKDAVVVDDCATWLLRLNRTYFENYVVEKFTDEDDREVIRFYRAYSKLRTGGSRDINRAVGFVDDLLKSEKESPGLAKLSAEIMPELLEKSLRKKWLELISANFSIIQTRDREAIQILNSVMVNNNKLRHYVIESSPNWADYSSIPYFMQVLPAVDADRQYMCLRVLGKLTGRTVSYSVNIFNKNRSAILADWLNWWKTEGAQAFS